MSDRLLLATFEYEDDLLRATAEARQRGYSIVDVYSPYAIHGLDRTMGLPPSRLTWVCFICAMIGALGMLWFEHWTAAINWPIDVGGKPWNSLPADVPAAFELSVLLAGFGSVFALFAVCRLYPGKRARPVTDRVTDDHFVLVLDEADATFDIAATTEMFQQFNAVEFEERVLPSGGLRNA
jgi:hypothetical protein